MGQPITQNPDAYDDLIHNLVNVTAREVMDQASTLTITQLVSMVEEKFYNLPAYPLATAYNTLADFLRTQEGEFFANLASVLEVKANEVPMAESPKQYKLEIIPE